MGEGMHACVVCGGAVAVRAACVQVLLLLAKYFNLFNFVDRNAIRNPTILNRSTNATDVADSIRLAHHTTFCSTPIDTTFCSIRLITNHAVIFFSQRPNACLHQKQSRRHRPHQRRHQHQSQSLCKSNDHYFCFPCQRSRALTFCKQINRPPPWLQENTATNV